MKTGREEKGFTLVELMIVVAIIGILAAIAIPNYLSFQCRSKQAEAKQNLGAIYTAMISYYAETNTFPDTAAIGGGSQGCWHLMHWSPAGQNRYIYQCGTTPDTIASPSPATVAAGCVVRSTTASTDTAFTVAVTGQIDGDDTCCDEWAMNDAKVMKNQMAGPTWGRLMNDCDLIVCP